MHGKISKDKILVKRGKGVVKFFKHNGYAVPVEALEQVRGVELHTAYDGVLYAPRKQFYNHGIANDFNGEKQLVLPVEFWEKLNSRQTQLVI